MSKTLKRMLMTAVIVVIIILMAIFTSARTSRQTRDNSTSFMQTIAQAQAVTVDNYVNNTADTLKAYASANEIKDLLLDPENPEKVSAAQKYTENFSATVANLEGIYASEWNTHVLVHTNPQVVGMITRKDEGSLKELHDGMMNSADKVYRIGFMNSPASGKQIVSMYMAVLGDDGQPVGLVGIGIYTDALSQIIGSINVNNAENRTYSMVNVNTREYIFNSDPELLGQKADDPKFVEICDQLISETNDKTDSYDNNKNVSTYYYLAKSGWLFTITTPSGNIYSLANNVIANLLIFTVICIVLIVIFNYISIKQEQSYEKLEKAKKKQQAISKNLHIAALKDILTDVNNRIKFIDDFGKNSNGEFKVQDIPDKPYCFAMFSIADFSNINITYGHDVGDAALVSTAATLKKMFGDNSVYRLGSDDFVVAVRNESHNVAAFIGKVNNAVSELQKPQTLGGKTINLFFSASAVKKSKSIGISVLGTLKDIINKNGTVRNNNVVFLDLDA